MNTADKVCPPPAGRAKSAARLILPRTLVVGLGNGGCKTVAAMARQWKDGPRVVAVNTDGRSLTDAGDLSGLQIGARVIKGLGTGGEPRMGQRAAESDIEAIRGLFREVDVVFLVVCLGGGTGTGAAPLLVEEARKAGALALVFASLPFEFEGKRRMEHARRGLMALHAGADAVICLPNQRLLKLVEDKTNIAAAFQQADEMLARGLKAVWCVISRRGVINLNFEDVSALVHKGNGRCVFACAEGTGPDKVNQVLQAVRAHALLNQGAVLAEAEAFLVSVMGGNDLSLKEVDQLMSGIARIGRAEALTMTGVCCESEWQDRLFVVFLVVEKKDADGLAFVPPQRDDEAHDGPIGAAPDEAAPPEPVARSKITQADLFGKFNQGRFKDVDATVVEGTNLDEPTFKRRGIIIQKVLRNHNN
ncbi:MAG: cell division protein FtsZ [Kiritimatiellia bacterium]|jgi:cell division protein FtsZ